MSRLIKLATLALVVFATTANAQQLSPEQAVAAVLGQENALYRVQIERLQRQVQQAVAEREAEKARADDLQKKLDATTKAGER